VKKINLTEKELARRDVIDAFNQRRITRSAAAQRLAISVRQLHILRTRYKLSVDRPSTIHQRQFPQTCSPEGAGDGLDQK
jgi:hypothetical protein